MNCMVSLNFKCCPRRGSTLLFHFLHLQKAFVMTNQSMEHLFISIFSNVFGRMLIDCWIVMIVDLLT